MDGSNVALAGSVVVDRVMVLPGLRSVGVTVKLIHAPVVTVRFPGTVSVSGLKACTLTVMLTETLAWGEAESVTVTVTENDCAVV